MLANVRRQINISLNEAEYMAIANIAKDQDRTLAYVVKRIVLENINGSDNTTEPTQPQ